MQEDGEVPVVRQPREEPSVLAVGLLEAASVDAARHHVLISVARRAGIGKAADQIVGVKPLEAFHVLRRVRPFDADQPIALGQPDLRAAVLQERKDLRRKAGPREPA